jgi:hypothetical protein
MCWIERTDRVGVHRYMQGGWIITWGYDRKTGHPIIDRTFHAPTLLAAVQAARKAGPDKGEWHL